MQLESDHFFNLSLDMLCVLGVDGHFARVNAAWQTTLGFAPAELMTMLWIDLVHPSEHSLAVDQWQKALVAPNSFKLRCCGSDGSIRWLLWNIRFCGESRCMYGVVRDITEQRESQRALRDSEERFRYLIESVKDYAIYMLDPNGYVISWNQGAARINGYQEHEIIGRSVSVLYPPEDVQRGKPEQELQVAALLGRFEDESWRVRRDGSRFLAHAVVTALHDKKGQLRGFAKVTHDVTERKRTEEALQNAYDELEQRVEERTAELLTANQLLRREVVERQRAETELRQSEAQLLDQTRQLQHALRQLQQAQAQLVQSEKMSSLGQLVAGVAHEINNPVNFIYGNLNHANQYFQDLLALVSLYQKHCDQPHPEIQSFIDQVNLEFLVNDLPKLLSSMKVGAERIREIVVSLRNFSRVDEVGKKKVDIHEGLDNTLMILQNRLKLTSNGGSIIVHKEYGDVPLVECYAGKMNQVFMNILSNAIDVLEDEILAYGDRAPGLFNPARSPSCLLNPTAPPFIPEITISTEFTEQQTVRIRIRDNGPGMSNEVRSRLFDPFFTTKPIGKGTGLGLSISYQIVVERHGGQLRCESTLGQGTQFIIEIPICAQCRDVCVV